MSDRTCLGCSTFITPGPRERNIRRWCSEACRAKANRVNGRAKSAYAPRSSVCVKDCRKCGALFVSRSARGGGKCKACTKPPGIETYQCKRCDRPWTRPRARGQIPKWCPDCRKGAFAERVCPSCNLTKPIHNSSKNCESCWHGRLEWFRTRSLPVLYVGPPQPEPRLNVHVRTASRLTSGQCRMCRAWFVSRHLDVTCSAECAELRLKEVRHAHRGKRRARKRNAFVANVIRKRVFAADGYRCHLCKRKTNPAKVVPHPRAPTIDHVIPLARGGTHEPINCRTACFLCNATKGDRGSGDQLMLLSM